MKFYPSYQKFSEKPIKYKQFIQEIQNSSRSSNHDFSVLSQKSFRQSYTSREHHEPYKNQSIQKNSQKQSPSNLNLEQNSYRISNPSEVHKEKIMTEIKDKLYTFCDVKITQKSIQIVNSSDSKNNQEKNQVKSILQSEKYFKINKQRNKHKQNIDSVNQILLKVESGGFQGKFLKTQNSQLQNLQKNLQKTPKLVQLIKKQFDSKIVQKSNSQRKIQSVKKVFVFSKPSSDRMSRKKKSAQNNMSEEKARQSSSICKNQDKILKYSYQKCSSKKKIVSLNINPLKTNFHSQNNTTKIKLSLDKSHDKQAQQKIFNHQIRGQLIETKLLSNSLKKMPSLDQSKIQSLCNEESRSNLIMSGTQLSQLTNFFIKQPPLNQEIQRLNKLIEGQKQKENRLGKQINELNQKRKHLRSGQEKKDVQILQKDCMRLANSYKEIKKLYEMAIKDKEEIQSQMQNVLKQNSDLKECLDFKSHEVNEFKNKLTQMTSRIEELQNQLDTRRFPSELQGLSDIIKQKITEYESQISYLLDENHKLTLLRKKLQNYNQTLRQQIEQKDILIESLEKQVKDNSYLKRSCTDQIEEYRQNELKLNKLCKELQSKLKLSNIHNDYLTKEIVSLKDQMKKLIASNKISNSNSLLMSNSPNQKTRLKNINTLANTITTRNSSICHGSNNFQHFTQNLNKEKELQHSIDSSENHLLNF